MTDVDFCTRVMEIFWSFLIRTLRENADKTQAPVLPSTHYQGASEFRSWIARFNNWIKVSADLKLAEAISVNAAGKIVMEIDAGDGSQITVQITRAKWDQFWRQSGHVEELTALERQELAILVAILASSADTSIETHAAQALSDTAQMIWDTFQISCEWCEYAMVYLACCVAGSTLFHIVCHSVPECVLLSRMRSDWCEIMVRAARKGARKDRIEWLEAHTPVTPVVNVQTTSWLSSLFA